MWQRELLGVKVPSAAAIKSLRGSLLSSLFVAAQAPVADRVPESDRVLLRRCSTDEVEEACRRRDRALGGTGRKSAAHTIKWEESVPSRRFMYS